MKRIQDMLVKQKESVVAYNSETMSDMLAGGEAMMTNHWSGLLPPGSFDRCTDRLCLPERGCRWLV